MKNVVKLVCIVLTTLFVSSCTINKPVEKAKTISVNGSGFVTVTPDTAELEFTVFTTGWSAKQIMTDSNTITNRFVTAVMAVGVSENDITISECVVSNPGSSYESKRSIKVVVRNLTLVGAIIDCKTPTIKLRSSNYLFADSASELRRARTSAIQNAQDSASLLAGACGSKIGEVISIDNENVTKTDTSDGKIKIQSDLTITYKLQ